MDWKQVFAFAAPAVVRGIAWVLAAYLGYEATQAQDLATQIGGALVALALAAVSIYTSIKGRQTLLATPPPKSPTP